MCLNAWQRRPCRTEGKMSSQVQYEEKDTYIEGDEQYYSTMQWKLIQRVRWVVIGVILVGASIPWWLWQDPLRWGPLPVYVWYHIGWMVVVTVVFIHFARRWWEPLGTVDATRGDAD